MISVAYKGAKYVSHFWCEMGFAFLSGSSTLIDVTSSCTCKVLKACLVGRPKTMQTIKGFVMMMGFLLSCAFAREDQVMLHSSDEQQG